MVSFRLGLLKLDGFKLFMMTDKRCLEVGLLSGMLMLGMSPGDLGGRGGGIGGGGDRFSLLVLMSLSIKSYSFLIGIDSVSILVEGGWCG